MDAAQNFGIPDKTEHSWTKLGSKLNTKTSPINNMPVVYTPVIYTPEHVSYQGNMCK
jgi:hypothetical protein